MNGIYAASDMHIMSINKYKDIYTNKLVNIIIAQHVGLKIPDTIITNDIPHLYGFLEKHCEIMMKPILLNKFIGYDDILDIAGKCSIATAKVGKKEITDYIIDNNITKFLPTMFQSYVDKKYEIRSFFLNNCFYSMAIFSQSNEKTRFDFRNYDHVKPNRTIPYKLPEDIEEKLREFMKQINMNSGSFDIIVTPNLEYIFLRSIL